MKKTSGFKFDIFKKKYLEQLKKFFIHYPYKKYQLSTIGISKRKMTEYLLTTIEGEETFNFAAIAKTKLVGFITLKKLFFLSNIFGYNIFSMKHFLYDNSFKEKSKLLLNYSIAEKKEIDVITCKVASDDITTIHILEDNNFNFVGNQLDLILDLTKYKKNYEYEKKYIREAKRDDFKEIYKIIKKVHTKNPYIYDPNFDNNDVVKLYCKILEYHLNDELYKIFVYEKENQVIGFITIKLNVIFSKYAGKNCVSLDFIGVQNNYQNKGIGSQLNAFSLDYLKANNYEICAVKTLSDNYYSIYICSKFGFKITSSNLLFHRWIKKV
ncbi:MAG TPA: GNAT family N-acetyltransferase [bacterium]|nr:GNAT family N-acetyltransferase [bacterium]HOL47482.1 GNAT family N-acetyltransferase [bacterium]HPQ18609.1 GNAT family N-acetyltransferase [bacterium]